jgi:hypothetical protein
MLVRQAASAFRTTNQTIPQQQAQDYDIQDDLSEDEHYEMPQTSTINENNDNSSILQIQISNTDEVRCNIPTNLSTYYKKIKNAQDNFIR